MKQYFIADTHFNHDKYRNDDWQETFWEKYYSIKEDFFLYILGDFCFKYNHDELNKWFGKLRGNGNCQNIILIRGNHDDKMTKYIQHGVVTCDEFRFTYNKQKIVLSHIPLNVGNEWINVHGHLHSLEECHRDIKTNPNNILVETTKIYEIDELIKIANDKNRNGR